MTTGAPRLVTLIHWSYNRGSGRDEKDPIRTIQVLSTLDGEVVAERDPSRDAGMGWPRLDGFREVPR